MTYSQRSKPKGFTLIELLVVVSIIGLLATLAVVALNSARVRARDAKRVADVQSLQTAMALAYDATSAYNSAQGCSGSNVAVRTGCSGLGTNFMASISVLHDPSYPQADTPLCPNTSPWPGVGTACTPCVYQLTSAAAGTYEIRFCLEGQTGNLQIGLHRLTEKGIE